MLGTLWIMGLKLDASAWITFQCFLLVVGVVFLLEGDQNERKGRLIFWRIIPPKIGLLPALCSSTAVSRVDTSVSTAGQEMTTFTSCPYLYLLREMIHLSTPQNGTKHPRFCPLGWELRWQSGYREKSQLWIRLQPPGLSSGRGGFKAVPLLRNVC